MGQAVINRLKRRIAELEEAMEPLVPFAMCDNYTVTGEIRKGSPRAMERLEEHRRQTMYMDMGIFRRIAELMKDRHGA